jgi:hypothetical protein
MGLMLRERRSDTIYFSVLNLIVNGLSSLFFLSSVYVGFNGTCLDTTETFRIHLTIRI